MIIKIFYDKEHGSWDVVLFKTIEESNNRKWWNKFDIADNYTEVFIWVPR
jgi:hypothetical protein